VKINTGSIINSEVIVEEGLSPGDLLITVGSHTITEGTRVKTLRKFEGGSKSR
jgi:hypothetical protein